MVLELIKQYPTISLIVLILILILITIIILQGRSVEIPWLKIGSKHPKKQEQSQVQSVQIYTGPSMTQEQLDEVAQRVFILVQKIQGEMTSEPNLIYHPPNLSSKIIYIHTVRYDFKNKLSGIVVNWDGGWAGVSLAGFDSFFDKATRFHLIPDELVAKINDFNSYTQQYINSGDVPDKEFLEIQYMAANISKELDAVIAN